MYERYVTLDGQPILVWDLLRRSTLGDRELAASLSRLDARTPGILPLSAEDRLDIAVATQTTTVAEVSRRHHLHRRVTERAVRDLATILSWEMCNLYGVEVSDRLVARRVAMLEAMDDEANRITLFMEHDGVRNRLIKVPHARQLMEEVRDWGRPDRLVRQARVSATPYQLRSIRRYLLSDDVEMALDGFAPLAARVVIGKWLVEGENVFGKPGDKELSTWASRLFAGPIRSENGSAAATQLRMMRSFLTEVLRWEEGRIRPRQAKGFIGLNGKRVVEISEADLQKSYAWYAQFGWCPPGLRIFGERVAKGAKIGELGEMIYQGSHYADVSCQNIAREGRRFMEMALVQPRQAWSIFRLTTSTQVELRMMKEAWSGRGFEE